MNHPTNLRTWTVSPAIFFISLSACQARSAKREEGGYIFLVVFAVCAAILPFLPRKKPQRDPFSLDIRRKKIPTGYLSLQMQYRTQVNGETPQTHRAKPVDSSARAQQL